MRDIVKQTLDIKLQFPVIVPAMRPCDPDGIQRRFSRPVSIRVFQKMRLNLRFKRLFRHMLRYAITDCWDPQDPLPSTLIRDHHTFYWQRLITPGRHSVPDFVEIVLPIFVKVSQRLLIYFCCSGTRFHAFI